MNLMDDGINNNSTKPIEFKPIYVDYNINLAEVLKLSIEMAGYDAEIIVKANEADVSIKIPFLIQSATDTIGVKIDKNIYYIFIKIDIGKHNEVEDRIAIRECIDKYIDDVSFFYINTSTICIYMKCSRLDDIDKDIEWNLITSQLDDAVNTDEELIQEKLALRRRLQFYKEEGLEFNLSGEWNATHGYEFIHILNQINYFITVVQAERENILRLR